VVEGIYRKRKKMSIDAKIAIFLYIIRNCI